MRHVFETMGTVASLDGTIDADVLRAVETVFHDARRPLQPVP